MCRICRGEVCSDIQRRMRRGTRGSENFVFQMIDLRQGDHLARFAQHIPARQSRSNGLHEMVLASGISLRLWRLYAYFWLICLLFPILALAQTPPAPMRLLLAL